MKNITIFFALFIVAISLLHAQDTLWVASDWNLIGAPTTMSLDQLRSEPPGIIISSYFGYSLSGYLSEDTLNKGKGYWVRASQAGIIIAGSTTQPDTLQSPDTMEVSLGWNLIGAASPMSLSQLRSEPDSIIISPYYEYSVSGYTSKNTLQQGKGYWVKANHAGIIISTPLSQYPAIPSNPNPAHGESNAITSPTFRWSCSDPQNDPLTYDVYLDTSYQNVARIVSSNQSDTSFFFDTLPEGKYYYWKVVARDNYGHSTSSPVWSFRTRIGMGLPCEGTPMVWYSGKTYHTVQIGTQCWLRENLNVGIMVDSLQNQLNNKDIEKYCYQNDPANCNTYGGLYQWNEAMKYSTTENAQGICPTGWHIPTFEAYEDLIMAVGLDANALKAVGQGTGKGVGTNISGFSAFLPGTRSHFGGIFINFGFYGYFWSSQMYDVYPEYFGLSARSPMYSPGYYFTDGGLSVRCLKD